MREIALQFYRQGYNCSQSILKAAELRYHIPISKQTLNVCCCVNMGFGMGGICCALIGGVMTFGLLFDEPQAKRLRIQLLDKFQQRYGSLNCAVLSRQSQNTSECENIIADAAQFVEELIEDCKRRAV